MSFSLISNSNSLSKISPSITILLFILLPIFQLVSADCWGLDGTKLSSEYAPCKPNAKHSGCCAIRRPEGSVDICLDNGLCMATNDIYMGSIWQDGCTDPTGEDPGCPKLCPGPDQNFGGLNKVLAWNVQMCDYGKYCCRAVNDHNSCCSNATAPQVKTNYIGAFQFPTSTFGVSGTPLPTGAQITGAKSGTSSAASTTASTTLSPSVAPNLTGDSSTCPEDKSAIVGGAVGGILGVAVLGLSGVIFWLVKRERHQRKMREHYEQSVRQMWVPRQTILVEADGSTTTVNKAGVKSAVELSSAEPNDVRGSQWKYEAYPQD